MSDVAEGIGGVIEGALTGRAVEPDQGKPSNHSESEGACRNCCAQPLGSYCQNCGQKVHVHRTLSAIFHDLIHGVLHLDGKFWLTLPLLVFKPGKLTRRYIEGERAKFVSPMAMFLFSVFAMFAVFQMIGLTTPTDLKLDEAAENLRGQVVAESDTLRAQIEALPADDPRRAELEEELSKTEELLTRAGTKPAAIGAAAEGEIGTTFDLKDLEYDVNVTGIESLDQGILKKWQENPGLMLYKLQANGYKFSWLLIPLSIPFVWLVFAWRRRFKAYDHAIFVTYSLSFMSLLFIAASLLTLIPNVGGLVALILTLVPPVHLYKQLRGAYDLSRFSAFWRLMALSGFIWVVLLLFLQTLLLIGAF
jgi:hypothetical protein